MLKNKNDIRPNYINDIANVLRGVAFSAGANADREFIRALQAVAVSFGITSEELRNGSTRTGRPSFRDDITAVLQSVYSAAGKNVHPEFMRAIRAVAMQFGIEDFGQ